MNWLQEKEHLGKEIIEMFYSHGMIGTWFRDKPNGWYMVGGKWTPIYINERLVGSFSDSKEMLTKIGTAMDRMIRNEAPYVNKIVGIASTGIPIATATNMIGGLPFCCTRKIEDIRNVEEFIQKISEYGQHNLIEGNLNDGDVISLVDDLVTGFDSKKIAREQVNYEAEKRNVSLVCKDVDVVIDREQGAKDAANSLGMSLRSLIPLKTKGMSWLKDKMETIEYETIVDYLNNDKKYQDEKVKREIIEIAKENLVKKVN